MSKSIKLIREQKEEYMDHLFDLVYEPIYRQYQILYQEVCQSREGQIKGVLKTFQKEVANIPVWNQLKVDEFYQTFLEKTKCVYFVDLLKTIYILSVKLVLLGLPQEHRNKIQIKIPAPETFLHRLLIHIARDVWKRPYLFYHQVKSVEQQNHLYQFEMIVRRKIRSVIRDTLPIDLMVQHMSSSELLKLQGDEEESSSSEDESGSEVASDSEDASEKEDESESEDEDEATTEDESSPEVSEHEDKASMKEDTESIASETESVKEDTETNQEADDEIVKEEIEPEIASVESVPTPSEVKEVAIVETAPVEPEPEHETIYEEPTTVRKSLEVASSSDESIPVIREEQPAPTQKKLVHIQELIRHKRKSHSRPKHAFF